MPPANAPNPRARKPKLGGPVAGRSSKGLAGLRKLAAEKTTDLHAAPDVAEGWLSLWCTLPKVSLLLKIRP